jgi:hypothetical protein
MIVEHWITKRIEKGKRRVFFKKLPKTEGRLTIAFRGILGIVQYNLKADLVPNVSWFYVDVPERTWRLTKEFSYVFMTRSGQFSEDKFKPSGFFENLL